MDSIEADETRRSEDKQPGVPGGGNLLLRSMRASDLALLTPHFERIPFTIGDKLATAGDPIDSVCFPEGAIAGVLDSLDGDRRFAVGLIGQEGFIGCPLLLGDNQWPYDFVMRAERGEALRIRREPMLQALRNSEALRLTLLRYTNVFMRQMARTIVSALAHSIDRRMARWILLYHDRVRGDEICLTHEEFGLMLGVRRSSITDALHILEQEHAIQSVRGKVIVRSRAKLIAFAGNTYGPAEREYNRLLLAPASLTAHARGTES